MPAGLPRPFEAGLALLGLAVASPVLLLTAVAVAASSRGPVLFRQQRVGRGGVPFTLLKFRSMRTGEAGSAVTAAGDPRITAVGRFLRRTKLDELPELWNVLRGDMSFVGPRPEVPELVDLDDPLWRHVLVVRPGLTDPVTLRLRNEEALLAAIPEGERGCFYAQVLQPYKLCGYLDYLERRTVRSDLAVLGRTLWSIVFGRTLPPPSRAELERGACGRNVPV